jgi:hypothetical protein
MAKLLLKKREELVEELKRIDLMTRKLQNEYSTRLIEMREKQRPVQDALKHIEALLQIEGWNRPLQSIPEEQKNTQKTVDEQYIELAHSILKSYGQPMHYMELFSKLKENGVYIPGKNPAATLLAKMSRDSRFKRIKKRGTYALSSWRIAAAKSRSRRPRKKRTRQN